MEGRILFWKAFLQRRRFARRVVAGMTIHMVTIMRMKKLCCCDHDHEHGHDDHNHDHQHGHGLDAEHHHHHADEIFTSFGIETEKRFTEAELRGMLDRIGDCGEVLRAKGILADADGGGWLHFDYVPGEYEVRRGPADYTGRLCVIGTAIDEPGVRDLFGI